MTEPLSAPPPVVATPPRGSGWVYAEGLAPAVIVWVVLVGWLATVLVAMLVFSLASGLDERTARARMLRDRLASLDRAQERAPSEELAILRDELLSLGCVDHVQTGFALQRVVDRTALPLQQLIQETHAAPRAARRP